LRDGFEKPTSIDTYDSPNMMKTMSMKDKTILYVLYRTFDESTLRR